MKDYIKPIIEDEEIIIEDICIASKTEGDASFDSPDAISMED